jgi:mannan endo-1,4-beta-mannosidase
MLPAAASAGFVARSGSSLTLDGAPYHFVGHNNYQLTSVPGAFTCGRAQSDAAVDQILQNAKDAGATVIRSWFFQSYFRGAGNSYAPFDRLLTKAAAKGLKVIGVLVNHYADCEPSAGKRKDEAFYDTGYKSAGWGYPQSYRDYAVAVADHYRSNPTIAFWQLVNEAEAPAANGTCNTTIEANGHQRAANVLRRFVDDVGAAVHAADPNHLVSLGTIGAGQCGTAGSEYEYVHASPGTDVCEYHDYLKALQPLPGDQLNGFELRRWQCNGLGKPLVVGEAGIWASIAANGTQGSAITPATLQRRADLFSAKLDAAFASGVAGYLLWEKIPDASDSAYNLSHGHYGVGPNDPLNAVTLAKAQQLAAGGGTTWHPVMRADFEDATLQTWELAWGSVTLASSTEQAFAGTRSLKLTSSSPSWPAARMRATNGAFPGTTITFRVYRPPSAPANVGVIAFVSDAGWVNRYGAEMGLAAGWNSVTFAVPAAATGPLQAIGLQLAHHGWAGSLYVDSISW